MGAPPPSPGWIDRICRRWFVRTRGVLFLHRILKNPEAYGITEDSEVGRGIAEINETLDKRYPVPVGKEADSGFTPATLTLGSAGVALILLTTDILETHVVGVAAVFAAACFAFSMPLLVAFGYIQATYSHPGLDPPSGREGLRVALAIYGVQLLIVVGLAALLLSYSAWVTAAFVLAVCIGVRLVRKSVLRRAKKAVPELQTPEPAGRAVTRQPEVSGTKGNS